MLWEKSRNKIHCREPWIAFGKSFCQYIARVQTSVVSSFMTSCPIFFLLFRTFWPRRWRKKSISNCGNFSFIPFCALGLEEEERKKSRSFLSPNWFAQTQFRPWSFQRIGSVLICCPHCKNIRYHLFVKHFCTKKKFLQTRYFDRQHPCLLKKLSKRY